MTLELTRRSLLLGAGSLPVLRAARPEAEVHLLLDPRVVERAEGVHLVPGAVVKDRHNPLFGEDRSWEVRYDNLYANVVWEDAARKFRCWYSPFIVDEATSTTPRERRASTPYRSLAREMGVCYAESKDGVRWHKPELGIVEFQGSRRNNLVVRGPHGAGVYRDTHDSDPAWRYKMFYRGKHIGARFSPDGLHWSDPVEFPVIDAVGDTHNYAFWAPGLGKYVGITRLWDPHRKKVPPGAPPVPREQFQRLVGRTESPDFRQWTKAVEVLRARKDEPNRQTYAMLVFGYANLYLGLVMMFNTDTDTVDCELAASTDTIHWDRICPGQPLIPRGPEGSYDSGCIYAAASPIRQGDQLLLYYGGSNGKHTSWRDGFFCLARLRADGFAGMQPTARGSTGTVITAPVRFAGTQLRVTADAAGGRIRVGILDAEGFELNRCDSIATDVTGLEVKWRGGPSAAALEGKIVRVQFELASARLYSFSFAKRR